MKLDMLKASDGFVCADEYAEEAIKKLKTGGWYVVDIKETRNPAFHRKVFAFFNFCYEYWESPGELENLCPAKQFDRFRKDLTILAGFYEQTVRLNGDIRTEAQSLAYGNMSQQEFEKCYTALVNAAVKHLFGNGCTPEIENKLMSFF